MARSAKSRPAIKNYGLVVSLVIGLVIVSASYSLGAYISKEKTLEQILYQDTLVWVVDDTIKPPRGLVKYLRSDFGCGEKTNKALYRIDKIVKNDYALVSLGCSYSDGEVGTIGSSSVGNINLDSGFAVIRHDGQWDVFSGPEYYASYEDASDGHVVLARCSIVDKYKVSKEFAPKCLEDQGKQMPKLSAKDVRIVNNP